MYYDPKYTPWGEAQRCHDLCPGVFEVSTASHGGIMVREDIAAEILSEAARKCCFHENGYLCFEEDCDAPVALRELIDKGLIQPPVNEYFKPGEYEACIDRSLQTWHSEYWQARGQRMAKENQPKETTFKKNKERDR